MKAKSQKKHRPVSGRDAIRAESNYTGGRDLFGLPFKILGSLALVAALLRAAMLFTTPEIRSLETVAFTLSSFMAALFFFGLSSLGAALFDLADCAIRRDARDRAEDAKAAYQNYQQSNRI